MKINWLSRWWHSYHSDSLGKFKLHRAIFRWMVWYAVLLLIFRFGLSLVFLLTDPTNYMILKYLCVAWVMDIIGIVALATLIYRFQRKLQEVLRETSSIEETRGGYDVPSLAREFDDCKRALGKTVGTDLASIGLAVLDEPNEATPYFMGKKQEGVVVVPLSSIMLFPNQRMLPVLAHELGHAIQDDVKLTRFSEVYLELENECLRIPFLIILTVNLVSVFLYNLYISYVFDATQYFPGLCLTFFVALLAYLILTKFLLARATQAAFEAIASSEYGADTLALIRNSPEQIILPLRRLLENDDLAKWEKELLERRIRRLKRQASKQPLDMKWETGAQAKASIAIPLRGYFYQASGLTMTLVCLIGSYLTYDQAQGLAFGIWLFGCVVGFAVLLSGLLMTASHWESLDDLVG